MHIYYLAFLNFICTRRVDSIETQRSALEVSRHFNIIYYDKWNL